ncbi:polyisoprenoid-binding protein [Aquitalea sp. FJL05]|nr:polyisoprenoid-binding protein [Aquitalea sp. FJL05]
MRLIPAALLLVAPLLQAAPLDTGKSQINFSMKQLNVPVTGSFKKFSGTVVLDLKKPETGKADISIDTASISLPTAEAVGEAKKADWFNVAKFPSARFVSSSIKNLGGGKLQVAGKLTIKGNTRDVTAPFVARQEGALTVVEGVLPVSRLAYKIGEGDWADTGTVADEVQIKFKVAIPAGK